MRCLITFYILAIAILVSVTTSPTDSEQTASNDSEKPKYEEKSPKESRELKKQFEKYIDSTISIDILPIEILTKILGELDLSDLLSGRLVNRNWNSVVNNYIKIEKLSIKEYGSDDFDNYDNWFDFELVSGDFPFFETNNMNFFENKLVKKMLSEIKVLNIHFKRNTFNPRLIDVFDQFKNLEILQLSYIRLGRGKVIKLSNLRVLSIRNCFDYYGVAYTLDLPKLEKFWTLCDISLFKFIDYSPITYLSLDRYHSDVEKFKNLQVLYCDIWLMDTTNTTQDLLTLLPSLKKLYCATIPASLAKKLLSDKIRLRRDDFKLIYQGFIIENLEDLNDYLDDNDEYLIDLNQNTLIVASNYLKTTEFLTEIYTIKYNQLIQSLDKEIDPILIKKLVSVYEIEVNEPIIGTEQFTEFIKNFKNLKFLKLKNADLPPSFYYQLPVLAPTLKLLAIHQHYELNLDFIFNLKHLFYFEIFQEFTHSQIVKILDELKELHECKFLINKQLIHIVRQDALGLHTLRDEVQDLEFRTRDELLENLKNRFYNSIS